jgi:hypothetical protein
MKNEIYFYVRGNNKQSVVHVLNDYLNSISGRKGNYSSQKPFIEKIIKMIENSPENEAVTIKTENLKDLAYCDVEKNLISMAERAKNSLRDYADKNQLNITFSGSDKHNCSFEPSVTYTKQELLPPKEIVKIKNAIFVVPTICLIYEISLLPVLVTAIFTILFSSYNIINTHHQLEIGDRMMYLFVPTAFFINVLKNFEAGVTPFLLMALFLSGLIFFTILRSTSDLKLSKFIGVSLACICGTILALFILIDLPRFLV